MKLNLAEINRLSSEATINAHQNSVPVFGCYVRALLRSHFCAAKKNKNPEFKV